MPDPVLAFLGGADIVLILVVCLLIFGAKKLPELARGLGEGLREFKKASEEIMDQVTAEPEAASRPVSRLGRLGAAPKPRSLAAPSPTPGAEVPAEVVVTQAATSSHADPAPGAPKAATEATTTHTTGSS